MFRCVIRVYLSFLDDGIVHSHNVINILTSRCVSSVLDLSQHWQNDVQVNMFTQISESVSWTSLHVHRTSYTSPLRGGFGREFCSSSPLARFNMLTPLFEKQRRFPSRCDMPNI